MRVLVVFASGLLLGAPVLAQSEVSNSSETVPASQPRESAESETESTNDDGGERKICRRINMATGSRMSNERICMTAEQWRSYGRES